MAYSQLAIIDKELHDILLPHGETVTIHHINRDEIYNEGEKTIMLPEFSLLDDPSVKCIPKIKVTNVFTSVIGDFEIHFSTAVPFTHLYEISIYLIVASRKLRYVQTLNAGPGISLQSIFKFPNITHYFFKDEFDIIQSNIAINGSFTIFTKICRKDISYTLENKPKMLPPSQVTDCSLLFENDTLFNFTIFIENREFRVHKEILAAKSPVFLSMFHQEMKEKKENLVTIEDIEADAFREMLRYIYTNNVHDLNVHAERLFQAADKYDIPKLKLLCVDELARSLKVENAIPVLVLADKFHENTLKERTITFIGNNLKRILETEDYKTWSSSASPHLYASILQSISLKQIF